jgi:hypothetical protein
MDAIYWVNCRYKLIIYSGLDHTTLTERKQPQPIGWIKTQLRRLSYSEESSPPLALRWTCIIQRHHNISYLVYYITRKMFRTSINIKTF